MANAWSESLGHSNSSDRYNFIIKVVESYWESIHSTMEAPRKLPKLFHTIIPSALDSTVQEVARAVGYAASKLNVVEASYQLGNLYTAVLPNSTRSSQGIFYTPPSLTSRLIEISENAGVDWRTARVVDPACGGGAFLAPVALKMVESLNGEDPQTIVDHIETHLQGYEIDPFGAWLSQVFVEVALKDVVTETYRPLKRLVSVRDSLMLHLVDEEPKFDLVIGNPPYGKRSLEKSLREKFAESLFGHANLYGLFTHLALNLVNENGVIGFLTPTSFLSGEYFKKLRKHIRRNCTPVQTDFITVRKGVFDGVLQEVMLTTYKKIEPPVHHVAVNQITTCADHTIKIKFSGNFPLPLDISAPWILPRSPSQSHYVRAMASMTNNLKSWGYQVSTGPLVWNRHKTQLTNVCSNNYPIIWSEAVTQDGTFLFRAEKKNHKAYFETMPGDDWLVTKKECIILQRTTAKEQDKRLISARLPKTLLLKHGGVIIENHLNMIVAQVEKPLVIPEVLNVFLNSKAVNESFRTISGSVAVSAYELESLPLPPPEKLKNLSRLVLKGEDKIKIEKECHNIFYQAR